VEQRGEYLIQARRDAVWKALNDAEVLGRCIPGCESVAVTDDNRFVAAVTSKIGPVKARFQGEISLEDLNPPESYTLKGTGQGGAAGFARGEARVRLEDEGAQTLLTYDLTASVGGKLAQVGSRLIDGAARKLADDFFATFKQVIESEEGVEVSDGAATRKPPRMDPRAMTWIVVAALAAAVAFFLIL
jgi:carbon monoxide dehydrogenase subunit G